MNKTIAILAAVLLAGCAAATPQEAREMDGRTIRFTLDDDYQVVYRRLVDVERKCFQTNLITASQIVNADLYPDTRTATISVGMYGIAVSIYQVIDIAGTESGTRVTATFPLGNVEAWGEKVRGWAAGSGTSC